MKQQANNHEGGGEAYVPSRHIVAIFLKRVKVEPVGEASVRTPIMTTVMKLGGNNLENGKEKKITTAMAVVND